MTEIQRTYRGQRSEFTRHFPTYSLRFLPSATLKYLPSGAPSSVHLPNCPFENITITIIIMTELSTAMFTEVIGMKMFNQWKERLQDLEASALTVLQQFETQQVNYRESGFASKCNISKMLSVYIHHSFLWCLGSGDPFRAAELRRKAAGPEFRLHQAQ